MTFWAGRITGATVDQKVALHVERWKVWDAFIKTVQTSGTKIETQVDKITIKDNDAEKDFKTKLNESKARWSKKTVQTKYGRVCFDASFGSLNSTSDLDINILSANTEVLDAWIKYMKTWHKENPGETFTNYYDSNFYFEPCIDDESFTPLRLDLVNKKFEWTTDTSYLAEFEAVKAYADAYRNKTKLQGLNIMPNPEKMKQDDEIFYLETCKSYAKEFTLAYSQYISRKDEPSSKKLRASYLEFAQCKIEGIVSIPALAICGVFGKETMNQFVKDKKDTKGLEIAVYEMLRNLQMHSHADKYKSKYANRLIKLVSHNTNLCEGRRDSVITLPKTNEASLKDIDKAIVFLLDFIDGEECAKYTTTGLDIETLIQSMEDKILENKEQLETTLKKLTQSFSAHTIRLRF